MKRKLLSLIILGIFSLSTSMGCTSANSSIDKSNPKPSDTDDTATIQKAISSLKKGEKLTLSDGVYYIDDTITIKNKEEITLVGNNTTIIRKGIDTSSATAQNCPIFYLDNCKGVTIKGITVKYDAVTSVSGTVVASDAAQGSVYIKPHDGINPTGKEVYGAINSFDDQGNPDMTFEKYNETGFAQTLMSNGNICISGLNYNEVNALKENTLVGLRASMMSDGVVAISNCTDTVFEDFVVRNSFSGVFFATGRTFNLTLRRVDISPENDNSYFSSNADGLHVASMGGKLTVEDCNFVKLGDDCVNVHGMAYSVTKLNGNQLTAYMERYDTNMLGDWADKGDQIEFYDKATFKLLGTAKIKKINKMTGDLTFDKLPEGVSEGTVMANKTLHPEVMISGCTVKSNRARAFLLQTENATVKNCNIEGTRLAAILIAPDIKYWYEMSPGRNINITGNTITNCGKAAGAAIITHASHDMDSNYPADVNRNITVEGNTFNSCPSAIKATSVNGLKFNNNILNQLGADGIFYAVNTVRCEQVEVGENNLIDCTVELVNN